MKVYHFPIESKSKNPPAAQNRRKVGRGFLQEPTILRLPPADQLLPGVMRWTTLLVAFSVLFFAALWLAGRSG